MQLLLPKLFTRVHETDLLDLLHLLSKASNGPKKCSYLLVLWDDENALGCLRNLNHA